MHEDWKQLACTKLGKKKRLPAPLFITVYFSSAITFYGIFAPSICTILMFWNPYNIVACMCLYLTGELMHLERIHMCV